MPVPRTLSLRSGTLVNIILKADQPTGRLTTGYVADILTRGDHPRGIKVRLTDGKVGRVQSLASASSARGSGAKVEADLEASVDMQGGAAQVQQGGLWREVNDESKAENGGSSLMDYVKPQKEKTRKGAAKREGREKQKGSDETSWQEVLEKEFPRLDSALIAAILSDNDGADLQAVRATLSAVS